MTTQRQLDMIQAFADYEHSRAPIPSHHQTIGMPLGSRLHRIIRFTDGWQLWTATADYVYGTYLLLCNSGNVEQITAREDEGDEIILVRPSDEEIRANAKREPTPSHTTPSSHTTP